MLTPQIIRKSGDELKGACADIIFADDLSIAEKNTLLAETISSWATYTKGMAEGYDARGEATKITKETPRSATGMKKGITKMSAAAELNAKAEELRKAEPSLTTEQAFAKAYLDPANAGVSQRFRDEERAAKGMLSRSDQPRSGWIPGAGNDGTHPHGTTPVDPSAFDGDPKGSTHCITTGTDQTAHGSSLDAVWNKYKVAVPGLTPKIFSEMVTDLARYGFSQSDLPVGRQNKPREDMSKKSTISDRVAALASSLKTSHPEMSHDDCVQRVLQRNKDLADAYERERAA